MEIHHIETDAQGSCVSGAGGVDFKPLAGGYGEACAVVEVVAVPGGGVFVVDGLCFGVNTDVVAFGVTRGDAAQTDHGGDEHVVLVDGDLIACVDGQGGVVVPVAHNDMAVETMVGVDIDEVDINAGDGNADTDADIGKVPGIGVTEVTDVPVTDKTRVKADSGAVHVF